MIISEKQAEKFSGKIGSDYWNKGMVQIINMDPSNAFEVCSNGQ